MQRALIGHTGFIGGALLADGGFTHGFDSRDCTDMRGARFDEVVCAGIPATGVADRSRRAGRAARAETVHAERFIFLISTIDVYPDPAQPLDEAAGAGGPGHPWPPPAGGGAVRGMRVFQTTPWRACPRCSARG